MEHLKCLAYLNLFLFGFIVAVAATRTLSLEILKAPFKSTKDVRTRKRGIMAGKFYAMQCNNVITALLWDLKDS